MRINWFLVVYVLFWGSIYGYFFFVKSLSRRKYDESKAVRCIVDVLMQLRGDDTLRSESNKTRIRSEIISAAEQVRRIHRISPFPVAFFAAPVEMKEHLDKIASRITQMNARVSIPETETLLNLRRRFVEWLGVFLKAEYGEFKLPEDFKPVPMPWQQRIRYSIRRHMQTISYVILILVIVGLWLADILRELLARIWRDASDEILTGAWLIARYAILVVVAHSIYARWGVREPGEQPESKWQNAVRLILFFFVPFFALDVLLQTGIVDKIIELVGKLKIF